MGNNILKKDFNLPECDRKALARFALSFLLPNVVFVTACFFLSAVHPLLNIDYLLPCLLLAFHRRLIRVAGVLLYAIAILLDGFTVITQFFHFLDLAALRDFIPFALKAPVEYILLYCLLLALMVALPLSAWILNRNQQKIYVIGFSLVIFTAFYLFGYMGALKYDRREHDSFASDRFFIHSQYYSIKDSMNSIFGRALLEKSELSEFSPDGTHQRASASIQQPYSHKILLVVVESLGSLKNEAAQHEVFRRLSERQGHYDFFTIGDVHIDGATVQGEVRELCNKLLRKGHDTRHFAAEDFSTCLPQILAAQGWHTVAFHGAGSSMYHRRSLYPKLGFIKTVFNEQMQDKKRCHSFHGTCDSEIFPLIADEFARNDRALVYWLTLTSHYPYSEKDIFNQRFDCRKYIPEAPASICRNIKMQVQFMDQLAELSARPEMKGVEVLAVGDHMPSAFENENAFTTIKLHHSAFVHFKIPE